MIGPGEAMFILGLICATRSSTPYRATAFCIVGFDAAVMVARVIDTILAAWFSS
jgi:hypothetical protein